MSHTGEIIIDTDSEKVLEIAGKKYVLAKKIPTGKHSQRLILRPMSQEDWEARLDTVASELVKKSGLTPERVVREALSYLTLEEVNQFSKLSKTKKVKVDKGCLKLNVGGKELYLIG
jgi:hypothetical protein